MDLLGDGSHLISRARKNGFSLFPVGRPQTPAPGSCLFSTRKSGCEVPERGDFGEENYLGKGGVDRGKEGKKDAQKKVGVFPGNPLTQNAMTVGRRPAPGLVKV